MRLMPRRQRLPDFLHPLAGPGPWAWTWCATGLAVLAAASVDAVSAYEERQAAQVGQVGQVARAEGRQPAQVGRSGQIGQIALGGQGAQGSQGGQIGLAGQTWPAWQQRLAYPWAQVFMAAEAAAAEGALWLSLSHAPGQDLLLEGEARSPASALATAAHLQRWVAAEGPAWRGARLQRMEPLERLDRVDPALAPQGAAQRLVIAMQAAGTAGLGLPESTNRP